MGASANRATGLLSHTEERDNRDNRDKQDKREGRALSRPRRDCRLSLVVRGGIVYRSQLPTALRQRERILKKRRGACVRTVTVVVTSAPSTVVYSAPPKTGVALVRTAYYTFCVETNVNCHPASVRANVVMSGTGGRTTAEGSGMVTMVSPSIAYCSLPEDRPRSIEPVRV